MMSAATARARGQTQRRPLGHTAADRNIAARETGKIAPRACMQIIVDSSQPGILGFESIFALAQPRSGHAVVTVLRHHGHSGER